MPGLEKPMQIKQKPDGWIVMDETGTHHFATKKEAEKHAGVEHAPVKSEKVATPDDKDLFAADA